MKKAIAVRSNQGVTVPYSADHIIQGRAEIVSIINQRMESVQDVTPNYRAAKIERDEWIFRWETVTKLLKKSPNNANLRTLAEQAEIHIDLSRQRIKALEEEMVEADKIKLACQEALKKLTRLELIYSTSRHTKTVNNELTEILVRTKQLEGSDELAGREVKRMEYYVEALLELAMERMK